MYRTIRKYLSENREQKEIIDGKVISKDIFGRATVQTATGTFKAIDLRGRGTASVMINNTAQNQNEFSVIAGNQERNIVQPTYYDLPVIEAPTTLAVVDTCNYRVQIFNKTGAFIRSFGDESTFGMLRGIASDSENNIYISEICKNYDDNEYDIVKYDYNGNYITKWDGLYCPYGIFAKNGYIYYAEGDSVVKRTPSGTIVQQYDFSLSYPMSNIHDVCVDSEDNIYVTYFSVNLVRKYSSSGVLVHEIGIKSNYDEGSSDDGKFWSPRGIAVDSQNNVYICDSFNNRIQKFDSSGNFILKFGSQGSTSGKFIFPWFIRIDNKDNAYITDLQNHRVQVFSSSGTFLSSFGSQGNSNGQFNMTMGICIIGE